MNDAWPHVALVACAAARRLADVGAAGGVLAGVRGVGEVRRRLCGVRERVADGCAGWIRLCGLTGV